MNEKELLKKAEDIQKDIFSLGNKDDYKHSDINDILKLSSENLMNISQLECELYSFKILQHCLYLQSYLNSVKSSSDFLSYQLRKIISKEISQYKGMSWENAEAAAISNNDVASKIKEDLLEFSMIISNGYNVVNILKDMAKKLEGLKFSK